MIDLILQPYAMAGTSYIKDTTDFILKVTELNLDKDEWMFTMDVSSLYTNIPHTEGIDVVKTTIQNQKGSPNSEYVIKLLSMVLKNNCFRFDTDFYLQVNGMELQWAQE